MSQITIVGSLCGVRALGWLDPTWPQDLEGSELSRTLRTGLATIRSAGRRSVSFAQNTVFTYLDTSTSREEDFRDAEEIQGEIYEGMVFDEAIEIKQETEVHEGETDHFVDAKEPPLTRVERVERFARSRVGRFVIQNAASAASYATGSYAGRAAASNLFENSSFFPPALLFCFGMVLALAITGRAQTNSARNWTIVASIATLVAFLYLQSDGVSGMTAAGEIVGGCAALRACDWATGNQTPILDCDIPSECHLVRVLPSTMIPPVLAPLARFIGGPILGPMFNLAAPFVIYYAAPINQNVIPLLDVERRVEFLQPAQVFRMLLSGTHERGMEGLVRDLATSMANDPGFRVLIEQYSDFVLTNDNAYNILVRVFNDFILFINKDEGTQAAIRVAIQSGDSEAVGDVIFIRLREQFSATAWTPIIASLGTLSQTLAANVIGVISTGERRIFGEDVVGETDLGVMQAILTAYLHGLLTYAMAYAISYEDRDLHPAEIQRFYQNLVGIVGQLYVERLPIPRRAVDWINRGAHRVIEQAIPARIQGLADEEKAKPTTTLKRIWGIFRLAIIAFVLYFQSFFVSKKVDNKEDAQAPVAANIQQPAQEILAAE